MNTELTHDPPWKTTHFLPIAETIEGWSHITLHPISLPCSDPPLTQSCSPIQAAVLEAKQTIEKFGDQEEWEQRKKLTNPYEYIFSMGYADIPVVSLRLSTPPLSRSYFKMIEMLSMSGFWSSRRKQSTITTAHVCEGPGGFIQAVIDMAAHRSIHLSAAYAMTLKPTNFISHIPGWRRSIQLLREHREIILEYGEDGTGNILSVPNQKAFLKRIGPTKASLFTADGGFDFSLDYSNQEHKVYTLLLSSFLIGLQSLQPGGYMIIKCFDIFNRSTQDLLVGSGLCFKDFTIYKPATSRPCNSERYFIGRGFVSAPSQWIQYLQRLLLTMVSAGTNSPPPNSLFHTPFDTQLHNLFKDQCHYQAFQQIKSIQSCFDYNTEKRAEWIQSGLNHSKKWCETFLPHAM